MWYRLDGHTLVKQEGDVSEWQFASAEERRVGQTFVGDVTVSTVFLHVDHGYGDGPPILFETMVFGGEFDEEQERYSTWKEAEEGHKRWVARVEASPTERRSQEFPVYVDSQGREHQEF